MKCEYGCGRESKYPPRKGQRKWCCEEKFTQCPAIIKKMNLKKRGRSWSEYMPPEKVVERKEQNKNRMKENNPMKNIEPWNKGRKGVYSQETLKKMRIVHRSKSNKGKTWEDIYGIEKSDTLKKKQSKLMRDYNYNNEPWNKGQTGCFSSSAIKKMSDKAKDRMEDEFLRSRIRLTLKNGIDYYLKTYPFFCKIEKIKEGKNKEILVKCKKCGKYFEATATQLHERIRQLEKEYGNDGCYFYCSDECKNGCPLYNLKNDPNYIKEKLYTTNEHQQFREHVLNRDNYKCQFCGEKAEHVHHERPQKLEPFHSLDPDLAWSVCKKCHYEKGHKDECSTGNLSSIICL
ncbi:MAG: hypothetical protein K9L62_10275 [Vallitaleaceae bacterium]|nr:hypothetical protein [Vallitaleaceae bacterium]